MLRYYVIAARGNRNMLMAFYHVVNQQKNTKEIASVQYAHINEQIIPSHFCGEQIRYMVTQILPPRITKILAFTRASENKRVQHFATLNRMPFAEQK